MIVIIIIIIIIINIRLTECMPNTEMNNMHIHKYSVSKHSLRKGRVGLVLCSSSICFFFIYNMRVRKLQSDKCVECSGS